MVLLDIEERMYDKERMYDIRGVLRVLRVLIPSSYPERIEDYPERMYDIAAGLSQQFPETTAINEILWPDEYQ